MNPSERLDSKDVFEDSNYINEKPPYMLAESRKPKEYLLYTDIVKQENKEFCSEIKSQKISLNAELGEISKPLKIIL